MKKYSYFKTTAALVVSTLILSVSSSVLANKGEISEAPLEGASVTNLLKDVPLVDGRLVFSSKETLATKISLLRKMEPESFSEQLYPFYESGFAPLVPVFKDTDEARYLEYFEAKSERLEDNKKSLESKEIQQSDLLEDSLNQEIDDTDDLISDDVFAALLNDVHELEVSGDVYKYTKSGIYKVSRDNVASLYKQLSAKSELTTAKLQPCNNHFAADDYDSDYYGYGYNENNGVVFFEDCDGGSGSSSGSSSGNNGSNNGSSGSTPTWQTYLASLNYCSPSSNIFGNAKICKSYFSSKYRMKTKFWNENYIVFRSIGVKVKHQKKGWTGLWRAKSTDEIRLGINQAYFEYTVNIPQIDYDPFSNLTFEHNGNKYGAQGQLLSIGDAGSMPGIFNSNNFDTISIKIDLPVFGLVGPSITADTVNDLFWDQLYDQARSIAQSNGQQNLQSAVITGLSQQKVVLNFIDLTKRKFNTKKIVKTFDWQVGAGVNISIDGDGGTSYALNLPGLFDYQNLKIDVYGLGRRGGTWRGSKLKFED